MSAQVFSGSDPIARVPHKCDICHREISVGQRYRRTSGTTDGDFWRAKTHPWCSKYYHKLWRLGRYDNDEPLGYDDVLEAADYADNGVELHDLTELFEGGAGI